MYVLKSKKNELVFISFILIEALLFPGLSGSSHHTAMIQYSRLMALTIDTSYLTALTPKNTSAADKSILYSD